MLTPCDGPLILILFVLFVPWRIGAIIVGVDVDEARFVFSTVDVTVAVVVAVYPFGVFVAE